MYYELKKKMPEIIEKATQQAVQKALAEAVPKAVAEAKQKERARFKQFCDKHGVVYNEEEWENETFDNENE